MAEIIEFFFNLQTNIKMYHWSTTSFARHKASDELVSKIYELSDEFVEVYIGKYGRDSLKTRVLNIKVAKLDDKSVLKFVDESVSFLLNVLPKMLKKDDVDLLNIRDELLASLNKTKYLFTLQ